MTATAASPVLEGAPAGSSADSLPGGTDRIEALDGLRGAAATVVVACHVWEFARLDDVQRAAWAATPLALLINGPAAVHVFFVLSGFVLALALARDPGPAGVGRFWLRRWLRIQPPFAAAVLFAWLASFGLPLAGTPLAPGGISQCLQIPADRLLPAMATPGMAFGQLPVGWSLWVELAMSFVFPAIFWVGRAFGPIGLVALGLGFLPVIHVQADFLIFTLDFAVGAALWFERERLARWARGRSRTQRIAWALAVVALLQGPYAWNWLANREWVLPGGHSQPVVIAFTLGSALAVVGVQHLPELQRLFSTPLARFLGRVSYSLYLVHWTVLMAVVCRVTGRDVPPLAAFGVMLPVVLGLSLAISEVGYRAVEAPTIRLGRWLGRRLGQPVPKA